MRRIGRMAIAVILAACSGTGVIEAEDAWGRSSPASAANAAFYVTLRNGTDVVRRLTGATSDRCAEVELHVTEVDDQGVMRMRPAEVALLTMDPDGRILMQPGGVHLMCIQVTPPPLPGEKIEVMLEFESAPSMAVSVAIDDR